VRLTSGGKLLFPLTSPPPKPDENLIAKIVTYDDREITVTVPFPDTLELVAEVVNDLLQVPDLRGNRSRPHTKNSTTTFRSRCSKSLRACPHICRLV
jgi:hypothetical protein